MEPSAEAPPPLPRRRWHLPSRTYRSLVRICSDFHGESQVSLATPTVLRELLLRSDNNADDEADQVSGKETCELGENAPKCCTDGGPGEWRIVSDDLENAATEKADNTYKENNLMLADIFDATDLQDGVADRHQMLMDELEHIINESEDLVPENCMNLLETSLCVNNSGVNVVASLEDNAKQGLDPVQNVVEKPSITTELQRDQEECGQKTSEAVDLSLEKGMVQEISTSGNSKEGRGSGDSKNYEETQLMEMEWEKTVSSTDGLVASATRMREDEDAEEGEIFGDVDIDFNDLLVRDDLPAERMDEKQVSKEIINKIQTACSHINQTSKECSRFSPLSVATSRPEIVEENKRRESGDKLGAELAYLGNQVTQQATKQEKVENSASDSHETLSGKKLDTGSCGKKRSTPSERKKAKKKEKYRKKRAEKNRLLGVRRLKLKPVVKPKPVKYCRHYLKGRCHEGENCKFSHDTLPLTKSSPCCYLATQSCMKGDDCPFDHDLSKYPCTNFTTKGFCSRGDNCLFSHKGSSQSALDASKSETAPLSVLPLSHSKEKQNTRGTSPNNVAATSFSFGILPQKTNKQTVTEAIKLPSVFPTRVCSPVAFGKPSSQPNQGSSFSKTNERGKAEISVRKPSVAPKGISFLSFDKTSSPSKDGAKRLLSKEDAKTSLHEQASSFTGENLLKVGHEKTTPSTNQNSNEMRKRSLLPPRAAPKGISFLSFGSDRQNGTTHVNASDQHPTPNAVQRQLQTSSGQSASGNLKGTPGSQTQKTLISALKLAAEFESGRMKKSTNDPAAANKCDSERTGVAGSSRKSSSKILEFLSSFSSKQRR